jgi:hypothetical protein
VKDEDIWATKPSHNSFKSVVKSSYGSYRPYYGGMVSGYGRITAQIRPKHSLRPTRRGTYSIGRGRDQGMYSKGGEVRVRTG